MSSTEATSEDADPLAVHVFELRGEVQRRIPILQLEVDIEQLTWLATTVTEMAVVKDDADDAERDEARSVAVETHLFDRS